MARWKRKGRRGKRVRGKNGERESEREKWGDGEGVTEKSERHRQSQRER